jgi:hypothetical protein
MKSLLVAVLAVSVVFAVTSTGAVKTVTPVAPAVKAHVPTLHVVTEKILKADTIVIIKSDTTRVITYDTIRVRNTLKDTSVIVKTEVDTLKAKAKK